MLAGKWGGLFLDYLLGKNFRRRDRDHLVPPGRMDAAVCRAEVCYPFGREHGKHRAVRRREFITLLGGAVVSDHGFLGTSTALSQRQWTDAFLQRLRELGWTGGRNLANRVSLGRRTKPPLMNSAMDALETLAFGPSPQVAGSASSAVFACHQRSATTATALSPTFTTC